VRSRSEFGKLVAGHHQTGLGAEVGTRYGLFARQIGPHWKGTIACIDKWEDREIFDVCNVVLEDPRYSLHHMDSVAGSKMFRNASLDWVYIDADHHYDSVKADLWAWFPKVRPGGILAGHDYTNEFGWGVKRAVDEFANVLGYFVNTTVDDWWEGHEYQTWWWQVR
jgi:hypothetical protein